MPSSSPGTSCARLRRARCLEPVYHRHPRRGRRSVPIGRLASTPTGSTVYTGAKTRFYGNDVNGACTQAQEQYLPHISVTTGFVYQCSPAGVWYRLDQQFTVKCWSGALFTSSIDQTCWLADNNYVVTAINEVHTVKEAGGTLTLIPRKATGTQATASGAALATALDMAAAATVETVRAATFTTTSADLLLVAGNRLGLDFTDDVAGELQASR
jgi:hypothetical protein